MVHQLKCLNTIFTLSETEAHNINYCAAEPSVLCSEGPVSEVLSLAVLCCLSLQITAATAQASIVKKTLFNKAMKSKTKDLRRLAVSVVMVIDTG